MADTLIEQLIWCITSEDAKNDTTENDNSYLILLDAGEKAIAPLLTALQATDHNRHHILASILGDILVEVGDNDALEVLVQLVYHHHQAVFTPVVRAIARMQLPQINTVLCELLAHPAPQVRRVVAWQLGRNQAVEAVPCLINYLDELDVETLRGIIWSLGQIGDDQVIGMIQPFVEYQSPDIAFIAKEAIQRIKTRPLNIEQ